MKAEDSKVVFVFNYSPYLQLSKMFGTLLSVISFSFIAETFCQEWTSLSVYDIRASISDTTSLSTIAFNSTQTIDLLTDGNVSNVGIDIPSNYTFFKLTIDLDTQYDVCFISAVFFNCLLMFFFLFCFTNYYYNCKLKVVFHLFIPFSSMVHNGFNSCVIVLVLFFVFFWIEYR